MKVKAWTRDDDGDDDDDDDDDDDEKLNLCSNRIEALIERMVSKI
jgi:hypothetical protein